MVNWSGWFYAPFLIALIAGAVILISVPKGDDVLFVNSLHSPILDYIFYYGTSLGNGWLYIIVAAGLLWKNYRNALIALISFALTGISVQMMKKILFSDMMRPSVLLADESLHFVEGVKIMKQFSFPSGHSATAFSLFCLLSLFVNRSWAGLLFLSMALIGGISRIYLVQHFFADVYFGALWGVTVTSIVWWWFSHKSVLISLDKKSLSSYFSAA